MSAFHPLLTLAPALRQLSYAQAILLDTSDTMDIDSEEQSSERAELHFLAAMMDELMKADRSQLQAIEDAVCHRIGSEPRTW